MKLTRIFLFAIIAAAVAACGKSEKSAAADDVNTGMPEFISTNEDSLAVRQLVTDFMTLVVADDFDQAISMLYDGSTIDPNTGLPADLTEEKRESYYTMLKNFNVTDYAIKAVTFKESSDNQVLCEVIIDDSFPTKWYFKPVKGGPDWRLTMRDSAAGDRDITE